MLHCNIALAARGGNSQLFCRGGGGFSELSIGLRSYSIDISTFSILARVLLSNEHNDLPIGVSNGSARESGRPAPSVAYDFGRVRSGRRGFRVQPRASAHPVCGHGAL